jgi:hypothetical protein
MKYFFLIGILMVFAVCAGNNSKEKREVVIEMGKVEFKEQDSGGWAMIVKITSVNDFDFQGIVEVVLLDENGQMISQFTNLLNDGDPIAPVEGGVFKYTADQNTLQGASRYQVQFVGED